MTIPSASTCILALASLAGLASAQSELSFAATALPNGVFTGSSAIDLQPDSDVIAELMGLSAVVLTDFPMPGARPVDLELARLQFDPLTATVFVDGRPAIFDPLDLTMWEGRVVGKAGSRVSISFSSHGCYGWIDDGQTHINVTAFPSQSEGWSRAGMRLYTDDALLASGNLLGPLCASDSLLTGPAGPDFIDPTQLPAPSWSGSTLDCKVAVETDHQLYQVWNDLQAEQTYVFALLAAVSDRYLGQINTVLTYPYVQFYTAPSDPWVTQDTGGSSGDLLNEFRAAWANNVPAGANLAHFLSGASLGGGVATVGTICSGQNGFAVSGNINGGVSFPVTQGSGTWDFFVTAHELGHNFGTLHTHNYCPPLDECADNCNNQTNCTTQGTNMSYCHGCPGGMTNITTFFHPTVVGVMRSAAEASCIDVYNPTTPTQLFADDFESGNLTSGGWTLSNFPAQVLTTATKEGSFGCRIRNKRWIEKTLDTTGYSVITVKVWRRTKNYDANEGFRLRVHDGTSWTNIEEADEYGWGQLEVQLPASAGNNPALRVRFKSRGSQGNERGDIDSVVIYGR